jgi:hypothetical protein
MSCNFCKHIKKQGMGQYCSKRNGKEIIYDQSDNCDYYEPLENAPSWVSKIKSAHHSASDQLHKVTEQRDRLAEAVIRFSQGTCSIHFLLDLAVAATKGNTND